MKKIKVFLGGYINSINAQNLNCQALAKHLDKSRFEVYTMEIYSGNGNNYSLEDINILNVFYPHRISKYIIYLWGILKCDVIYLPKREICGWNLFWIRLLKKKSFTTIEGIFGKEMLNQILDSGITYENFKKAFKRYDKVYSITEYLHDYNKKHHNIETEKRILYLGTATEIFLNEQKTVDKLKKIIFIGRLKKRKGVFDILEIARSFPSLNFYLAGNGEERETIESYIRKNHLHNIELLGTLTHPELAEILKKMDLHLFPSRSEGFPKVTLETAAAGVPSVVYPDYGAHEWIEDRKNGFIVNNVDEIKSLIEELLTHPEILSTVSKNAIEMAKQFDWKIIIKDWERVIEELYES